jgi:protein tyrosine phosphatase (PTP) superfamily phosphohydrolase (DUF442 family)
VLFAVGLALALAVPAGAASRPAAPVKAKVHPPGPPADSAAVLALLDGVMNRACPLAGVATGGQPDAAHVRALAKAGYRVVFDLRTPEESRGFDEAAAMKAAGLRYETIPVGHGGVPDSTFDAFRKAMRDTDAQGVFVHCASGNRVGAVMIPWLVLDRGWDLERAVASAKAGGLRSPALEAQARDYVAREQAAH